MGLLAAAREAEEAMVLAADELCNAEAELRATEALEMLIGRPAVLVLKDGAELIGVVTGVGVMSSRAYLQFDPAAAPDDCSQARVFIQDIVKGHACDPDGYRRLQFRLAHGASDGSPLDEAAVMEALGAWTL